MIWTKLWKFIARYWHWVLLFVAVIVLFALTFKQCDSARVYVFGPADKVNVRVK